MMLFGTIKLDYKWGIEEKLKNNLFTINDVKWLFEQSMCNHLYLHYTTHIVILRLLSRFQYSTCKGIKGGASSVCFALCSEAFTFFVQQKSDPQSYPQRKER
jgi:hypothetical protein